MCHLLPVPSMAAPSTGFGAPGVTRSYWVTKGWNHLARHRAAEPPSKSSLRALPREALPWAHTCAEPGEEKTGEQDKTRKSRDPKHGPRETFCRNLHFLLSHKKLGAFPRRQKLSVEGGSTETRKTLQALLGQSWGEGSPSVSQRQTATEASLSRSQDQDRKEQGRKCGPGGRSVTGHRSMPAACPSAPATRRPTGLQASPRPVLLQLGALSVVQPQGGAVPTDSPNLQSTVNSTAERDPLEGPPL